MFITQKKKPKRQIAVNTSMYIKERFKAPRDICQSTFKVTGQTPGLFGYCSSTSTLIPDSGPKSALEIWKELLMSSPASLLRGCEILLHFTAHISTVGYVTPHLKGTRSKEVILPFSPPHTLFKLLAGANSSSLGTSMSSEGFTLGQSQPTITDLTVFLFFWRAFSFFFQMVGYCSSHNSLCSSQHPGSQEPQSSKDAVSWNQELKDSFLHLSLFLLAGDHITPYCWKPQRVPLLSHGGGWEGKVRRQTHFLSNKRVLVKNITELSWLLVSFTAAGGSKAAETCSHEASLAAMWQRWGEEVGICSVSAFPGLPE